jgi:hypothetical protein
MVRHARNPLRATQGPSPRPVLGRSRRHRKALARSGFGSPKRRISRIGCATRASARLLHGPVRSMAESQSFVAEDAGAFGGPLRGLLADADWLEAGQLRPRAGPSERYRAAEPGDHKSERVASESRVRATRAAVHPQLDRRQSRARGSSPAPHSPMGLIRSARSAICRPTSSASLDASRREHRAAASEGDRHHRHARAPRSARRSDRCGKAERGRAQGKVGELCHHHRRQAVRRRR